MRKKEISPEVIIEATITFAAQNGLETTTTKKVANELGISEGTIFHNFPTKKALLVECFYYIDKQVDVVLKSVHFSIFRPKESLRKMWYSYFHFFVEHGNYAKYYAHFRGSSYYDSEIITGQKQSFSFFADFLRKNMKRLFRTNPEIFWPYVIETTLTFAIRIANGKLPADEKTFEDIHNLLFNGINGISITPKR